MEQYIKDQITYGLRYLPWNLIKYPFLPKESKETKRWRSREFLCGVCHPSEDVQQAKAANISWVRFDIPFPFDREGNITQGYLDFKERCRSFRTQNVKVMAITPYPHHYFEVGVDVRTKKGEETLKQIARFLLTDLQGLVSGLQITNEMGMPHFTLPLNVAEAARFIGVQLEAIHPIRGEMLIGYNSAFVQADLHSRMRQYLPYCDYVGIDIYMGCFFNVPGFLWVFDALLNYLWAMTRKPIILMEFGYISAGSPKTASEKLAVLNQYGAKDEADANAHMEQLVEQLPAFMRNHVKLVCENDSDRYYNFLFHSDYTNHLYKELPKATRIPGYGHTYEGQAKFYRDLLPCIYRKPFMAGAFVYSYRDADRCHVCGQDDCPTETRWGLTERDGTPKPAWYAVQEQFANIQKEQSL